MVGVPGKYKGCNTCRTRRVKCDNQRPFCKKCMGSGRECLGYERETVFIVGTVEDKGRCSSHPPRNSKGSKKSPSPPITSEVRAAESESELVPVKPLQPAWSDQILLSSDGTPLRFQVAALYTPLNAVSRDVYGSKSETTVLSLPPYTPINVRPTFGNADFELHAQCLAHDSRDRDGLDLAVVPGSLVLFLYDQNFSLASSNLPPWSDPVAQQNRIRQLGPGHFRTFPSHHFYARVYRPSAIATALLNRKGTFCADPEWTTVPFELHDKCPFDRLLDLAAQLPALLQRLDQLLVLDPTLARRLAAQDLLGNWLSLQAQLEQWFSRHHLSSSGPSPSPRGASPQPPLPPASPYPSYWVDPQEGGEMPFPDTFSFRDPLAALSLTYYWAVQALAHPSLEILVHSILSPVVDVYPPVFPDLPPQLVAAAAAAGPDGGGYGCGGTRAAREAAAGVCRGLDCALRTTAQPDLLGFPATVAEGFYASLGLQTGDGALELMWLASFRARMAARGQDLASLVAGRRWMDLAAW